MEEKKKTRRSPARMQAFVFSLTKTKDPDDPAKAVSDFRLLAVCGIKNSEIRQTVESFGPGVYHVLAGRLKEVNLDLREVAEYSVTEYES